MMPFHHCKSKAASIGWDVHTQLVILAVIGLFVFMHLSNLDESFALQYTNHTSDKYLIKFQYPSTWQISEKSNRFDEYADIRINDTSVADGSIFISVNHHTKKSSDESAIQTITESRLDSIIRDPSCECRVIESPSYLDIDGHSTGTFVYTRSEDSLPYASQVWYILLPDRDYVVQFTSSVDTFDKTEYIKVRETFIKSIEVLKSNR